MRSIVRTLLLPAFLLVVAPVLARAQGIAKTLDELRLLTRPGETVTVTDKSGSRTRGRITSMSPATIDLLVNGQPRSWTEADVTTIAQRRGDSLGNGALWGLGIGAGLATIAVAAVGVEDGDAGWAALAIAFYGGAGAGIGAGIDALIKGDQVIFERPGKATADWRLAPVVAPGIRAALVSWRF